MKINSILLIVILCVSFASNAQIDKGNWMMGGGAAFSSYKNQSEGTSSKATGFQIHPIIGYFVIDNVAVGASAQFAFINNLNNNSYGIGPFVRYYLLKKEKPINIFSEARYEYSVLKLLNAQTENFNVKLGTVYFLNDSVGIEVALNYSTQKSNQNIENQAIYLNVGFQIHLERE